MKVLLCFVTYAQLLCKASNVGSCIEKVVYDYAFANILYAFEDLPVLVQIPNYTLTTIDVVDGTQKLGSFDFYIFSIRNVKKLQSFLSKLQYSEQYSSGTPVVAYIEYVTVSETLEVFWMYNLINVLVLTDDLTWYTYYPISQGHCGPTEPTYLFKCSQYISSGHIYNESRANYFENCSVRIYAIVVPPFIFPGDLETNKGAELVLLRNVLNSIKATPTYFKYQFTKFGVVLINGTERSIYEEVRSKRAEIVVGFNKFDSGQANVVSPIFSHFNFYAPIAAKVDSWKNIFLVFDVHVWCYTIVVLLVLPIFWFLCSSNQSLSYSFLLVIKLLLSPGQYKPGDLKTSFLYVFWIFAAFLVISFYQSVLISVIFKPTFEHQVSTLEEMIVSKYHYGGTGLIKHFFAKSDSPTLQKIHQNFYACSGGSDKCLGQALRDQNLCVLLAQHMSAYYLHQAKQTLYKIDYEIYTRISMMVQRGYPLSWRMEQVIGRMADAGLVAKWDVYGRHVRIKAIASNKQVAMTLVHLRSSFAILVVGNFLATVAFILEGVLKSRFIIRPTAHIF